GQPMQDPMIGPFQVVDELRELWNICKDRGLLDPTCRGIIRAFQRKDYDDYEALQRILIGIGVAKGAANFIVEQWMEFQEDDTGDGSSKPRHEDAITRIRKNLGKAEEEDDEGPPMSPEEKELVERSARLKLAEERRDIEAREAALKVGPASGKHMILVNIAGYPQEKQVTDEEERVWAPFICRMPPGGQVQTVGLQGGPVTPEVAELKAKLAAAEEREKYRKEEEDRAWRRRVDEFIMGGGASRGQSEVEKLREEMRAKDAREAERLRVELDRRNDPNYLTNQVQAQKTLASAMGMKTPEEIARDKELKAEQIALQDQANDVQAKAQATAEFVKAGGKRLQEGSVAKKTADKVSTRVLDSPAFEKFVNKAADNLVTDTDRASVGATPDQAEMEAAAAQLGRAKPAPTEPGTTT
ncbi:MAG: hypothetical protein KGR26_12555, partial [Cyanobacteria bacterium REEB65]|nr:hypothetical protein [Cyanobacteria bacterium REEB65]